MTREEAAKIYLDGLMNTDVKIDKFFEAARTLSNDDKTKIQVAVERYKINWENLVDFKSWNGKERY
ncbi:MAG: hypothetical protein HY279_11770 [Nitrospinae bacterium]|nr:hypothetical protein [Nitrospinota bacterium]